MSHLANLVTDPKLLLSRLRVSTIQPKNLRRIIANIPQHGSSISLKDEQIGELQQRIIAWSKKHPLPPLSRRDLRNACKTLLLRPHPIAEDDIAVSRLLREVERNHRRAAFFSAIDAYLDGFERDKPTVVLLAGRLKALASQWPWRATDGWPKRISEFALLDPVRAPEILARRVFASGIDVSGVLKAAGLETPGRRFGGMVEAAFRFGCHLVMKLQGQDAVSGQRTLIAWARNEAGGFGYGEVAPEFVQAILIPWQFKEPSKAHKLALIERLQHFGGGDPRTESSSFWSAVKDHARDAYAVLMRWLTQASVLQFLDIVDRLMPDPAAKLMWSYRRAFWLSYLLNDESTPGIDAAWVAFGDDGARLASQVASETGDTSFKAFGRQEDKSSQHAALILRIGELTIVDWSHNAKYQVWMRQHKRHPELFKKDYPRRELYGAPIQGIHSSPSTFTWQKKLASLIEGRNILSPKPSWRPKGV